MRRAAAAVAAVALLAAGCGGSGSGGSGSGGSGSGGTVTVFAAASLTDAFAAVAAAYRRSTGQHVTLSFAGSQSLVAQVQQGAPADVLATADTQSMDQVTGQLRAPARTFAHNRLVIVTAKGNPDHIHTLTDLTRRGVVVVLAAPAVPAGRYAREALAAAHVTVHPKSLEDNVRGVLTKVELGEADAGIVYRTDASSTHGKVTAVPIATSPVATYPIAALTVAGQRFVDFVLSSDGQRVLRRFGFLPP